MNLNEDYWQQRYQTNQTAWDAGSITTPLKDYFDSIDNKHISILIPGAGNAHEAEYLHRQGFTKVFVLDIAEVPLKNFQQRCPDFPHDHLLHHDFFSLQMQFDLIVEQTFFCALHPSLRMAYAEKMASLLSNKGVLMGVLFDHPMNADQPPFGGSKVEYQGCFEPYFDFVHFEACYNSIPPRAGKELFILLRKK